MISKRFTHRDCVICCCLARVSLHFFLSQNHPFYLSLETNPRTFHKSVLGAPGAFPIHSFCRSAVIQCTPSTTRLEPAQVDDDTLHSHSTFSLLVPSLCCVADLSQVCEMNPVVSGWCCMLSTQPLSIDPRATCPIHHLRAKE